MLNVPKCGLRILGGIWKKCPPCGDLWQAQIEAGVERGAEYFSCYDFLFTIITSWGKGKVAVGRLKDVVLSSCSESGGSEDRGS